MDEVLNNEGRKRLAAAVADYVLTLDENPLSGHPERLPLRVVGDGLTPRYQDDPAGRVTSHGRGESSTRLRPCLGTPKSASFVFAPTSRLKGLGAWEEQSWVGRKVRIGTVDFDVVKPKLRCLATYANPKTGERDLPILTTLTRVFGQEQPTFAVAMVPSRGGGRIHAGDEVSLVD